MWICEYDKNVLFVKQQNRFLVPLKSFTIGRSKVVSGVQQQIDAGRRL